MFLSCGLDSKADQDINLTQSDYSLEKYMLLMPYLVEKEALADLFLSGLRFIDARQPLFVCFQAFERTDIFLLLLLA
ncbi:MAG: hypothetical protein JXA13_00405 [Anaerolineales bacterium]|nr:hypothetical protein [Anaerolineales bacterium]